MRGNGPQLSPCSPTVFSWRVALTQKSAQTGPSPRYSSHSIQCLKSRRLQSHSQGLCPSSRCCRLASGSNAALSKPCSLFPARDSHLWNGWNGSHLSRGGQGLTLEEPWLWWIGQRGQCYSHPNSFLFCRCDRLSQIIKFYVFSQDSIAEFILFYIFNTSPLFFIKKKINSVFFKMYLRFWSSSRRPRGIEDRPLRDRSRLWRLPKPCGNVKANMLDWCNFIRRHDKSLQNISTSSFANKSKALPRCLH